MVERPIIFSAPMVRSILAGRKTQTRRILKPRSKNKPSLVDGTWTDEYVLDPGNASWLADDARFAVGDLLWVREAFYLTDDGHNEYPVFAAEEDAVARHINDVGNTASRYGLSADWLARHVKKRPSIHMPRWASRITLKVTGVKVERLNEISEDDAVAEGIGRSPHGNEDQWLDYPEGSSAAGWLDPRHSFRSLWESINGPGSWDANPWVAAISFERAAPPDAGGGR